MDFPCSKCEKVYKSKHALSQHVKVTHDNIYYACDKCNFEFTRLNSLVVHKSSKRGARKCRTNILIKKTKIVRSVRNDGALKSLSSLSKITTTTTASASSFAEKPDSSRTSLSSTTPEADSETTTASTTSSTNEPYSPKTSLSSISNLETTPKADTTVASTLSSTEPQGSPRTSTLNLETIRTADSETTTSSTSLSTEPQESLAIISPTSNSSTIIYVMCVPNVILISQPFPI